MDRWHVEYDIPNFVVPNTSPVVADFDSPDVAPDGLPEAESGTARSWSVRCLSEDDPASCDFTPDEPNEKKLVRLPGIEAYTRLIKDSPGYESLLANLRREHLISSSHPNSIEMIRKAILVSLPESPFISRMKCTESFHMAYYLRWDFFEFHDRQRYTVDAPLALENAICLTGSSTYSQALTCREYVLRTWPSFGGNVLELLCRKISERSSDHFQNSMYSSSDRPS